MLISRTLSQAARDRLRTKSHLLRFGHDTVGHIQQLTRSSNDFAIGLGISLTIDCDRSSNATRLNHVFFRGQVGRQLTDAFLQTFDVLNQHCVGAKQLRQELNQLITQTQSGSLDRSPDTLQGFTDLFHNQLGGNDTGVGVAKRLGCRH